MARPREFDRDGAVERAMSVFWRKGYAATSTDDLLRAMNIGRQSLYDTFGDKHRLYLEALQRYNAGNVADHIARLHSSPSPATALHNMLLAMATQAPEQRKLGCMGINAICE